MSEKHFAKPATAEASSYFSMYLPHIQPLMQDLLRTLANIDFEHEIELEKLEASTMEAAFKRQIRERLKERHRERREPYVQHLAELHTQATSAKVYAA
jgi:hypothetical protein